MKDGVYRGLSNEEYHSSNGYYSSSQLKDNVDDPEIFYSKHIAKTVERVNIPAFDIGTYFHTSILEPEKMKSDCAVYKGIRRGAAWEKFQEENKGKAIITETEEKQTTLLADAVRKSPIAMNRIKRGEAEVSAFTTVYVDRGEIFAKDGKRILGINGWEKTSLKKTPDATAIKLKVRADLLGDDFILDLKSTTGNVKNAHDMRQKVSNYSYDFSAAMYLDVFTIELEREMSEFVWTFASKDLGTCKSWIASPDNIRVGRKKFITSIHNLVAGIKSDWVIEDSIGILEPEIWQLQLIKPKIEDLL